MLEVLANPSGCSGTRHRGSRSRQTEIRGIFGRSFGPRVSPVAHTTGKGSGFRGVGLKLTVRGLGVGGFGSVQGVVVRASS